MENKKDERGLLRQQMELLAERSESCADSELRSLTLSMVEIYQTLYWQPQSARGDSKRNINDLQKGEAR